MLRVRKRHSGPVMSNGRNDAAMRYRRSVPSRASQVGPPRFVPGGLAEHCPKVDRTARSSQVIKTGFDGWDSRQSFSQLPPRPLLPAWTGIFGSSYWIRYGPEGANEYLSAAVCSRPEEESFGPRPRHSQARSSVIRIAQIARPGEASGTIGPEIAMRVARFVDSGAAGTPNRMAPAGLNRAGAI
jgi:hypothetical protein